MNTPNLSLFNKTALVAISLFLSACGGTRLLDEPQPIHAGKPLVVSSDSRVQVSLDWVIVRDGPGTWARNADWDEYQLTVTNLTDQPLRILGVNVVDSMGTTIESQAGRKSLVKGSKTTARRYRGDGIKVKAGMGTDSLVTTGAVVTVAGVSAAAAALAPTMSGGVTMTGSAGAAAGGLLLLGPAIAVGGIVRGVNNSAVNRQIEKRQTVMPLQAPAGQQARMDVFFPLAPSPQQLVVVYADHEGEYPLMIDTRDALDGLHIVEVRSE